MKGALVGRLWAIRSWLEGEGSLPLEVKFLAEGEEEIGSPHLDAFVQTHTDLLTANACVWESGGLIDGQAEIVCGCKGVLVVELTCRKGEKDLHSASAAVFDSAAWRLLQALSTLYDDRTGQCTLDGYLDPVRPPSPDDWAMCERLGLPDKLQRDLEASGRERYHASLRNGAETVAAYAFRPTCNLQGIVSGYTGEGMKNVLPRVAKAKLDFRLVADQDPGEVLEQLRRHLERRGYGDLEVRVFAQVAPSRSRIDDPLVRAMARAAKETYGKEPLISPSMGGFGPMHTITKRLGIATIMGGDYQRPGGSYHAPDEHLWLEDFYGGIDATIRLIRAYAEVSV